MIKCSMSKYDIRKATPPYEFVHVGDFEIDGADDDSGQGTGGTGLYAALVRGVKKQGRDMQFYTLGTAPYKYNVVVCLTYEEWPHCPEGHFGCHCGRSEI
jgi:hypothetical protein